MKSSGELRYCKKCQSRKPDRAHHCSTCARCVLKMDHHCPWLATCVGFRNYKPFLLSVIYTTLFCWLCFVVSASWIYTAIIVAGDVEESLMPVNYIILSVLSGIIGLVVGGFTGWHIHLTLKGRTTIESLEQTRYLHPLRQQMSSHLHPHPNLPSDASISDHLRNFGDQIIQTHANALPGVLRPEEGLERASPAQDSLQRTQDWDAAERARERARYLDYLDEQANEKLPNAFDLGRRENWTQVMGLNPYLWFLPICNAVGDGWTWRVSEAWREASERAARKKEEDLRRSGFDVPIRNPPPQQSSPRSAVGGNGTVGAAATAGAGRGPEWAAPQNRSGDSTPLREMDRNADEYETSSDEETLADAKTRLLTQRQNGDGDWNDVPAEMVVGRGRGGRRGRRPGR